jgi:hypothetical protein
MSVSGKGMATPMFLKATAYRRPALGARQGKAFLISGLGVSVLPR